ncbi:MAG: hypothetical protein M2R45_02769 [Verrucomicrobia subdivision 3 bacterium]|nr:hypothetical protein [Limisphaerales bacterium]MCS1414318.1 hypothetical protein [Limisphaerales bacterium]
MKKKREKIKLTYRETMPGASQVYAWYLFIVFYGGGDFLSL